MANKDPGTSYIMAHEGELKRLSYNHELYKSSMNGWLHCAPVDFASGTPKAILDSATADGLWLRDLASTVASSDTHSFTGTDIDPSPFPASSQNFTYQVQDVNKPWPASWTSSFDFVHQRLGLAASPDLESVIKGMAALVKPGGWIELVELSDRNAEDAGPMARMSLRLMHDLFTSMGTKYFQEFGKTLEWLRESGFENVEEKFHEVKLGAQQSDPDLATKSVASDTLVTKQLCAVAKSFPPGVISLSLEDLNQLLIEGPRETEKLGKTWYMHSVWGRKKA